MYFSILFVPLISSACSFFLTRLIGKRNSCFISIILLWMACIFSWLLFYDSGLTQTVTYIITVSNFALPLHVGPIPFFLIFDSLTLVLLIVVLTVSAVVHTFSFKYMEHDERLNIFFCYISLFTFFMLVLVCSGSFFHLFFGWEGVGLCSYLLINFWYTRIQANKAAIKAMLVNRVGDMGLTLAMLLIFYVFKSLNYGTVFAMAPFLKNTSIVLFNFEINCFTLISILLFIGAVGKSAQIGLHTWLPDAMEGPTPVSALIHAATMVTAGVFLLARCSPIIEYSDIALTIITLFGAMTSFFAATTGLFQNDLKKVIAYSTCSQLGYMVFACGLSNYSIGVFHLANHAFFKALLFLTAGSIIHALNNEQDMRRMGGLVKLLPFSYAMIFIGSLALTGFPFLSGFYSKDVILEVAYAKYTFSGHFAQWLGCFAAFFTAFYSIRLLCLTFLNKTNIYISIMKHVHDAPPMMALPLILLVFGSIFFGYIFKDLMIGLGSDFWGNAIFVLPSHINIIDAEFIPTLIKFIPFFFTIFALFFGFFIYFSNEISLYFYDLIAYKLNRSIYTFFNKKWFFDRFYNSFINQTILKISFNIAYKNIDKGIIEYFGPQGLYTSFYRIGTSIMKLQNGSLISYAIFIVFPFLFIFFFIFFPVAIKFTYLYLFLIILSFSFSILI